MFCFWEFNMFRQFEAWKGVTRQEVQSLWFETLIKLPLMMDENSKLAREPIILSAQYQSGTFLIGWWCCWSGSDTSSSAATEIACSLSLQFFLLSIFIQNFISAQILLRKIEFILILDVLDVKTIINVFKNELNRRPSYNGRRSELDMGRGPIIWTKGGGPLPSLEHVHCQPNRKFLILHDPTNT